MRLPHSFHDTLNTADFNKGVNDSRRYLQAKELAGENASAQLIDKVYKALPEYIPDGVSLAKNRERAKNLSPGMLIERVRSNGIWDYKRMEPYGLYEDFGNTNFAVTADSVGFPEWFSKMGAGFYQISTGTSPLLKKDEFGKTTIKSRFDAIIENILRPGSADDEKDQKVMRRIWDAMDDVENARDEQDREPHMRVNEPQSDTFDRYELP